MRKISDFSTFLCGLIHFRVTITRFSWCDKVYKLWPLFFSSWTGSKAEKKGNYAINGSGGSGCFQEG